MNKKCLLCNEEIDDINTAKSIELENSHTYSAHIDCLSALQQLMSRKIELPPQEKLTSKDLIYGFYLEGWFSIPRGLSNVKDKLQQNGFNFDLSTISHNLRDLTQRGILTRQGKRGNYEYIQKKPPK